MADREIEEELIARLAHRPRRYLHSMITIDNPQAALPVRPGEAKPQDDRPYSLGLFDQLPLEIVHLILHQLDVHSLTQFSYVAARGRPTILSLPAYQILVRHAPQALAALRLTKLMRFHSISHLLAALTSSRCATCPAYGPYLFLPPCERCCWNCLRYNPARRVVTQAHARTSFALSLKEVRKLPVLFSLPGRYDITRNEVLKQHQLVSVSAARDLALSIHGSAEKVVNLTEGRKYKIMTALRIRFLQRSFTINAEQDPLTVPDQGNNFNDPFFGFASIPFPSLSGRSGVLEHGLWCKGCEKMHNDFHARRLPTAVLYTGDPYRKFSHMLNQAYSRSGLLRHSQKCCGAEALILRKQGGT